jgi:hypothetical protein
MLSERARRLASIALIAGGIVWAVSWFMVVFAEDEVLGLSEGAWRALLNPALVALMFGAWIFYVRLGSAAAGLGLVAAALVELGLLGMLVGNVMEYGLTGDGYTEAGWDVFVPAVLATMLGLLVLGVAIVRTGVVRRESSIAFAGGLAAFVGGTIFPPAFGIGWLLWGYVLLAAPPVIVPPEYNSDHF